MKTLGAVGNLIAEKTDAKERATIKGAEIAKLGPLSRRNVKFSGADFDIEVVSFNPIEGGVEVFARAWDANGQIGFGQDGSVDIERFRIFNPPILVTDGTQTLTELNGEPRLVDNFKEDHEAAILQSLVHTISIKKEKFDAKNIVEGKVGNTTSTFYPVAGANSPCDGYAGRNGVDESFATIIAGAGNDVTVMDDPQPVAAIRASATSNQFQRVRRGIWNWDTSSIPDTDAISSAVISHYGTGKTSTLGGAPEVDIVAATPAATNNIVNADYGQLGSTVFASIAISALSTSAYNNFTLDANGRANISKTGVSSFGGRINWDTDASFGGSWASGATADFTANSADAVGTSTDPKLVVEHGAVTTTLNLSENLSTSIIERLTRAWTAPRSQSDVLILQGESTSRTWNAPRSPSDVITITETISGIKGRIIEIMETLGINESFTRSWAAGRSFSESLGISETFSRTASYVRGLTETQTTTEYISAIVTIIRTLVLSEVVSIIDTVRTPLNWLKRTVPTTIWTKRTKP